MDKYVVRVLFFTGFNPFYDKIIAKETVEAKDEESAINAVKEKYPGVTGEFMLKQGVECLVLGKWKSEFKYQVYRV